MDRVKMDQKLYYALHPKDSSFDKRARGRKLHLKKNWRTTMCNLSIQLNVDPWRSMDNTVPVKKICKNCLNASKINLNEKQDEE